jgi:DNA topoisomerase-1
VTRTSRDARAASSGRLRYVHDGQPGIRRRRTGRGFTYTGVDGRPVRDDRTLDRIRSLAVPPAWTDVWICPVASGHIQATGRDARGRKQYRYHPRWREVRDEAKYDHLVEFGEALPAIRARVRRDLARDGLPREKVLATVVHLLDTTFIRVGNDEYARENGTVGLTTMKDGNVRIEAGTITFRFRGKAGKWHTVSVHDTRLARIVRLCRDVPGYELFQYVDDDGSHRSIGSDDVNAYLRECAGDDVTAKDFRTWAGTVCALKALAAAGVHGTERETAAEVVRAVEGVADRLGNTPAVCRKAYVHPDVIESYLDGSLDGSVRPARVRGLHADERALLALLRRRRRARGRTAAAAS